MKMPPGLLRRPLALEPGGEVPAGQRATPGPADHAPPVGYAALVIPRDDLVGGLPCAPPPPALPHLVCLCVRTRPDPAGDLVPHRVPYFRSLWTANARDGTGRY